MRIEYLPLLLLALISFQSANNGQTKVKALSNETQTIEIRADASEEVKIPAGVKTANFEESPSPGSLTLTLGSDKQIYYENKAVDNLTLKNILKASAAKTKKLPKTTKPSYLLDDEAVNSIYLKADAQVPFSEVVKILKMVQESSPNEYRAKFIVRSADQIAASDDSKGRYVFNFDLGLPRKPNAFPKPNPLMLVAKLDAAGKINLNNMPPMTASALKTLLLKTFKDRENNGVFIEGTNEVVKEIILVAAPEVKYGEVVKLIDELHDVDANPIVFGELSADYQPLPASINE